MNTQKAQHSWLSPAQQLRMLLLEAKMDLLTLWRTPAFVIPSLIFPIMFYLLFGVVFGHGNQSTYLLVTYGCFGVMGPALFNFGVNVATEKSQGWLLMKQLSPAPVMAYLFGKTISSLVFAAVITVLLFSVGVAFGGVRLYTWQWFSLFLLLQLGTIPFCLLGLFLGMSLSARAAPAVVNLIYLPLAFLGGLWIPIQLLPAMLQQFAWALPSYHFSQLALTVISADQAEPWWQNALVLVLFTLICGLLVNRSFRQVQGERQ